MVVSSCQIIGYLTGVIAVIGVILATAITDWKHNTYSEEGFGGIVVKKGLWSTCSVYPSGSIECKPILEPFFDLPVVMRGCRVISILSALFGFCGLLVTPLGMHCTRIGGDKLTKLRLARCGAVLFGVSGILIGAAVSWYADDVANSSALNPKAASAFQTIRQYKYVYGNSIFIGWGAMVAGILSGVCIGIGSYSTSAKGRSTASPSSESRALTLDGSAIDNSMAVLEAPSSYVHNKLYGTNSSVHQQYTKHSSAHNNNYTKPMKHYLKQSQSVNHGYASTTLAGKNSTQRPGSFRNGRANTIATMRGHERTREIKTYV